jgi:hypothetical protein
MTITTTRADCTRDNRKIPLPRASLLGMGKRFAKRGDWIRAEVSGYPTCGRVIGRVTCEGKVFVEVAALGSIDSPYVKWLDPAEVRECVSSPPRRIWEWISGDWTDPEAIHARLAKGFLSDSYLDTYGEG